MKESNTLDREFGTIGDESVGPSNYLSGLLGAILGALVGTVPWIIVSLMGFYVGWLGFVVGWASLIGYRFLRGAKNTAYATMVIFACSILGIILADFAANMYTLMREPDIIKAARYYDQSVFSFSFELLVDPENLHLILPNLGIGLVIGVLGIFSAKGQIVAYTNPASIKTTQTPIGTLISNDSINEFDLPRNFSLTLKRSTLIVGIVCLAMFGGFALLCVALAASDGDSSMFFIAAIFLALSLLGVLCIMGYKNRRIEVSGEQVTYSNLSGKRQEFSSREFSYITTPTAGTINVFGAEGKKLFTLEQSMTNYPLFVQYLAKRNVGLRGQN